MNQITHRIKIKSKTCGSSDKIQLETRWNSKFKAYEEKIEISQVHENPSLFWYRGIEIAICD